MKKINNFINQYSLSKTLQFKLIPYGKTYENFMKKGLLEEDEKRNKEYKKVKKIIDKYHKSFIDSVLKSVETFDVSEYAELYFKSGKSDSDKKKIKDLEAIYRKKIYNAFKNHENYKMLFKKEMITKILPEFITEKDDLESVAEFDKFATYFHDFQENRKNMYTKEEKSTGIAYRCINENLHKFLDNVKVFGLISETLLDDEISKLNDELSNITGRNLYELFSVDGFSFVLSAFGINRYNKVIGGYTTSDGLKIQGINEKINLYNQQHQKSERLPNMKMLYKQILSDRDTISFIPEMFESDDELLTTIKKYYNEVIYGAVINFENLFADISVYNADGIYLKNGPSVTDFSNKVLGSWSFIRDKWNDEYDSGKKIKNYEKHVDERNKQWKRVESFSLSQLQQYIDMSSEPKYTSVYSYFENTTSELIKKINEAYIASESLLNNPYTKKKRLAKNNEDIEIIKNLLDSIKELEWFMKPLNGAGNEEGKDYVFYGIFEELLARISGFGRLYDKVRNYITKKPYSNDKIKLNFENPNFLEGWALGNETANSAQLFMLNGQYYLAVMDKNANKALFKSYPKPINNDDIIEKMIYQQIADPSKDVPNLMMIDDKTVKKNGRQEKAGPHAGENLILEELKNQHLSPEINRIRKEKTYIQGETFVKDDLSQYIAFYSERVKDYYSYLTFSFKEPRQYLSYKEFLNDIDNQKYQIKFENVSLKAILDLVDSGNLYLFQIYNKDFSPYSKGTPNLHTMYFKMLFDERNLNNVVYQLNGSAEMFYRSHKIEDEEKIVHPKNMPIKNKNPDATKKESVFEYDIIKDKRYTEPQFSLHLPIKLNFKAVGNERINNNVRMSLKNCEENYVIGIDRGERHLLYITVVAPNGEIVEQFSANQIISGVKGQEHSVDYHKLLDRKEKERLEARQSWETIENIKELKEGYISQVVHKICELVLKYDAIIAMEDLNSGFKNSRAKVEKQVYQKFEKMLIDKLNYYVNKQLAPEDKGGLLNAYQLTEKFVSFERMGLQNGFIFYVPAWLTSKIDPTTGFVDLLKPKYTSVETAIDFISRFDTIKFNEAENYFEFSFDYKNFPKGSTDYKGKWTICSYGDRIKTERSNAEANGNFISKKIVLTDEFINLFKEYDINYRSEQLKNLIISQDKKDFFAKLLKLMNLTLQMRNSVTGTDEDYLISPVKNNNGEFYDSRKHNDNSLLPANADANGAYNIARKAHWAINVIKETEDDLLIKAKLSISNKEWLEFVQK